ncbi:hypothetical protein [Bradyrhizobium sp.]|jgi:hypothetical protein|uniref:hypothetical protein n=1 Tax=Bradyrhizobium sp. TaxID=376 RepID=UPI003C1E6BB5
MTDKAPDLQSEVDRHHGHAKTKKELDHDKLLNDAIEKEEVQENLEYIRKHACVQAAEQN